jgi:xylan 1,4-beta-xylosidase
LDVVLFHAKGSPRVINGDVVMNMGTQLRNIRDNFTVINHFPELKNIPVIIGENDPEGCAACGMATNPENAYRNGTMYSSYTAAAYARVYALADTYNENLKGAVSWSFEFENQPWFAGFRDLATNGVDKPVLNVFRMFGKMKGERVALESSQMYPLQTILDSSVRTNIDVGGLASKDTGSAAVMLWNYHDADKQATTANIMVQVNGVTAPKVTITRYRIDATHSNAYEAWKKMGSPRQPTREQVTTLEKEGQLQTVEKTYTIKKQAGVVMIHVSLPKQGVELIMLDW